MGWVFEIDNIKNKKSSETRTKKICEIEVPKLPDLKKKKKNLRNDHI
jgi:hypothetical protein